MSNYRATTDNIGDWGSNELNSEKINDWNNNIADMLETLATRNGSNIADHVQQLAYDAFCGVDGVQHATEIVRQALEK